MTQPAAIASPLRRSDGAAGATAGRRLRGETWLIVFVPFVELRKVSCDAAARKSVSLIAAITPANGSRLRR